jgi:hypothetical protein
VLSQRDVLELLNNFHRTIWTWEELVCSQECDLRLLPVVVLISVQLEKPWIVQRERLT